jgi:C1A family cysteine protease
MVIIRVPIRIRDTWSLARTLLNFSHCHKQLFIRARETSIAECISLGLAVIVTVGIVPYIWQTGTGEVVAPPGLKTKGNHAVLAVGTLDRNGSNFLLVKNSWGPDWGDLGYGYISDRYLSDYGRCAHVIERET